jgi:hypothetical protein
MNFESVGYVRKATLASDPQLLKPEFTFVRYPP